MSEKEYIESLDDQIAWYNKKSAINKKYHLRLKALIITFSVLIPLQQAIMASLGSSLPYWVF